MNTIYSSNYFVILWRAVTNTIQLLLLIVNILRAYNERT